jgi:hypothetical protein
MMVKMIYLAQRHPALARDEFPKRWRRHAVTAGTNAPDALTEIQSASYCHVRSIRDVIRRSSDEYDGVALFGLRGLTSIPWMHKVLASNEVTMADELRTFSSFVKDFTVFTASVVLLDGPETSAAVLHFVRRTPGIGPGEFGDRWRGKGQALVADSGGSLSRYVMNEVISIGPPGYRYDGVAELWFNSFDDIEAKAGAINELGTATDDPVQSGSSVLLVTDVVMRWPEPVEDGS